MIAVWYWLLDNIGDVIKWVVGVVLGFVGIGLVLYAFGFGGRVGACSVFYRSYTTFLDQPQVEASGYKLRVALGPLGTWTWSVGINWLTGTAASFFPFALPRIAIPTLEWFSTGFPWQDSSAQYSGFSFATKLAFFDFGLDWDSPAGEAESARNGFELCV